MRRTTHALMALAAAAPVPGALAQQVLVGPARRANPPDQCWAECNVAARPSAPNEVVVCAEGGGGMAYAISLDGGLTFTRGVLAGFSTKDNALAVDPVSERIWAYGLGGPALGTIINVAWKQPGATHWKENENDAVDTRYAAVTTAFDKPLMAIGFPPGSTTLRHFMGFLAAPANRKPLWMAHSDNPLNKQAWTAVRVNPSQEPGSIDYKGWAAVTAVLGSGRVVMVLPDTYTPHYNARRPVVIYSDDGGLTWQPPRAPPVPVGAAAGVEAPLAEDYPSRIDNANHFMPMLAVDPISDEVYVAFFARAAPGSSNIDIYIGRSSDGGSSFPTDASHLVQLTDGQLGLETLPDGPDQFIPAMAIDGYGGVNLVFYDNRADGDRTDATQVLDVYYARITGFGTPAQSVLTSPLTSQPFTLSASYPWLGDYHNIAATPATLYAAYIASDPAGTCQVGGGAAARNCFVHKIVVCPADFNNDGFVDGLDADGFRDAFEGGAPSADVNADGFVDGIDSDTFENSYEGRC